MSSATVQYKKPDIEGGILTEEKEIAYYKQVQANDVLNNLMLGDFNLNGNYIVKKEILIELIALTKVLQHTYGKTIFCISAKEIKKYGHFEFAVKIERQEDKKAVASLELLEAINKIGGYYQNINTVLLATYTDTYDLDFLKKVYKAFNIISKEDEYKGRKKLESETIDEILARKDYLSELKKNSDLNLSETERKFFEARIEALSKGGEYGKAVLVRMQLEANKISKIFLKPDTPEYYQKMNQLLDKVLEDTRKTLDKGLVEKLNQAQEVYIKSTQTEILRAKDELFKSKTLPENVVLNQLNQQKKAETQKETPQVKYTPDIFKQPEKKEPPLVKVQAEMVESKKAPQTLDKPIIDTTINKDEDLFNVAGNIEDTTIQAAKVKVEKLEELSQEEAKLNISNEQIKIERKTPDILSILGEKSFFENEK